MTSERAARGNRCTIRPATPADARQLAELARSTFLDTFADQNTAEDMALYLERNFSDAKLLGELSDPANSFLLAFVQEIDTPVGYAKLTLHDAPACVGTRDPIQIERLYLARACHGRGIGADLMRACFELARDQGSGTIWLGVWELNTAAIEFYRRWGFERVGSHSFVLGADRQTDLILSRAVGLGPKPWASD